MLLGYVSSSLMGLWSTGPEVEMFISMGINTLLSVFPCVPSHTYTTMPCRKQTSLDMWLKSNKKSIKKQQKGSFNHSNSNIPCGTPLQMGKSYPVLPNHERVVLFRFLCWLAVVQLVPLQTQNGLSVFLKSVVKGSDNYAKPEEVRKAEF